MALTGIVRGKFIHLDAESGFPDGQCVKVTLEPRQPASKKEPGEGLLRAFGGWSDDPEGVDRFVEETYRLRRLERPESSK